MADSDISGVSSDHAGTHQKVVYANVAFSSLNDGTQPLLSVRRKTFCPYCSEPYKGSFLFWETFHHARAVSHNPNINTEKAGKHEGLYQFFANQHPHEEWLMIEKDEGEFFINRIKYCWPLVRVMVGSVADSTNRDKALEWGSRHGIPFGEVVILQTPETMSFMTLVHFTDSITNKEVIAAREFDNFWMLRKKGKMQWIKHGLRNAKPFQYGWLATEEDRNEDSELGRHLMLHYGLQTMDQMMDKAADSLYNKDVYVENLLDRITVLEKELMQAKGNASNTQGGGRREEQWSDNVLYVLDN